jgi:hypothetical protein
MGTVDYRVLHIELKTILVGSWRGFTREDSIQTFNAIYQWKAEQIDNDQYDDKLASISDSMYGQDFEEFMRFVGDIHDWLEGTGIPWRNRLPTKSKPQAA